MAVLPRVRVIQVKIFRGWGPTGGGRGLLRGVNSPRETVWVGLSRCELSSHRWQDCFIQSQVSRP